MPDGVHSPVMQADGGIAVVGLECRVGQLTVAGEREEGGGC